MNKLQYKHTVNKCINMVRNKIVNQEPQPKHVQNFNLIADRTTEKFMSPKVQTNLSFF